MGMLSYRTLKNLRSNSTFLLVFFFVYIDKISVASSSVEPGEPLSITWQLHTVRVSTLGILRA